MKVKIVYVFCVFFVNSCFSQNIPNYVPKTGLLGWWPFNGNTNDESGLVRHGKNNGAELTKNRFNQLNSAYYFDGSDYISTGFNGLPMGTSSRSVSMWLKPTKVDGQFHVFFSYGLYSYSNLFAFGIYQGNNNYYTSTYNLNIYSARNAVENELVHFVLTYNSSKYFLYFNGKLSDSGSVTTNTILDSLYIGKDPRSNFIGIIDDVGIWNRALSPSEVLTLYNPCGIEILNQPKLKTAKVQESAVFNITVKDTPNTYQWQMLSANKYVNLSNGGQYSGVFKDTLKIANLSLSNSGTIYSCLITRGSCVDSSDTASLLITKPISRIETNASNKELFIYKNLEYNENFIKAAPSMIGKRYSIYDGYGKHLITKTIDYELTNLSFESLAFSKGFYYLLIENRYYPFIY